MFKTRALDPRIARRAVAAAAIALLAGTAVQASARCAEAWSVSATPVALSGSSSAGHTIFTSRGPAFVAGHAGSMDTVILPGSGGQGFLSNNGNGSSTLFSPGLAPQTVFTPR